MRLAVFVLCALLASCAPTHPLEDGTRRNRRRAKNIILFIGDGMSVSTVTAARILEGQLRGETGEENVLSFEKFPHVALSKTYTTNQQVSDSAASATAMLSGHKTNTGYLGTLPTAARGVCEQIKGASIPSIFVHAEANGLNTGIVTNARLSHATPAAAYAHSSEREWESDIDMPAEAIAQGCKDMARQLVEGDEGRALEIVFGGGRRNFRGEIDGGSRKDGRDLIQAWKDLGDGYTYVGSKKGLDAGAWKNAEHVLGIFHASHMTFEMSRDKAVEPSLSEMTKAALDYLSRDNERYLLMVEGARIDHGHHAGNAHRALTETIEFARAVTTAVEATDERETLIIVTADHSHVFGIVGYPTRGNPILGKVVTNDWKTGEPKTEPALDASGRPYTTLIYGAAPGYTGESDQQAQGAKTFPHIMQKGYVPGTGGRANLTKVDTTHPDYLQEATLPSYSGSHGGEDVPIYAFGPGAHMVHGVMEQNLIFFVMSDAARLTR